MRGLEKNPSFFLITSEDWILLTPSNLTMLPGQLRREMPGWPSLLGEAQE